MIEKIKKWYQGDTKAYDVPGVIGFYTQYHWTAKVVRRLVKFYLDHWKWIWTVFFVPLIVFCLKIILFLRDLRVSAV